MPLLPSHTLLQTYSLTLGLTSYLLFFSPLKLLNASPLWLLGESMHIKPATFIPTPSQGRSQFSKLTATNTQVLSRSTSELLSLLAFFLLLAAITQSILASPLRYSTSDLTHLASKSISSTSNDKESQDSKSAFAEKLYNLHSTQTIFLTLSAVRVLLEGAFIAYIYLFFSTRTSGYTQSTEEGEGIFALLANRVVFTIAMGDMLFWGYMWTVLRDEAREVAELVQKRRIMEEEMEMKQ